MPDIIQLLPDVVASQIAAGEVIQRPASAVKELMENAIDSGATHIKVIVREAGKALIQVCDNGIGMSETDARMSFERYATSKLKEAGDLYILRTMGFRGEALASIAAISQVEMKTKRAEDEAGVQLVIEGAELISNQPVAMSTGTTLSIKNLFFNVPARRNFLKSNAVEMRHILEEFQRVALANPETAFSLLHNETEIFNLKPSNFRQRISTIFGNSFNERLVPVEEETDLVTIRGYVGKPEFAKRTRGEQYFFVNQRFIRDPYLHHAVANAFEELLSSGTYPSYFLLFEIDPARIDINIHPTKSEIKFEDDKSVYAILRSSVKRALGKYNVAPTLNFEQESSFNLPLSKLSELPVPPKIQINPSFNPFKSEQEIRFPSNYNHFPGNQNNKEKDWSLLYRGLENVTISNVLTQQTKLEVEPNEFDWITLSPCFQLELKYIIIPHLHNIMVIDQQSAHERILFEKNLAALSNHPISGQQLVFPQTIELTPMDFALIQEMKIELKAFGFDFSEFGKNTFIFHAIPVYINQTEIKITIEKLIEQYHYNTQKLKLDKTNQIALAAAMRSAVKHGQQLQIPEMKKLISDLFSTTQPQISPSGNDIFFYILSDDLEKKFSR